MIKTVAEAGPTLTTVTPSPPATPRLIADRYEIERELGAGGMGRVFLAHDQRLRRDVAIKMLSGAHGEEAIRRFEVEARAAGSLNHPHVLSVHDIGTHEGAPFIVSELLEGQTLRSRLANGALPLRKTLDLAVQLARGLSAAHEKGVIHRDLKPENLFLTTDGRLKILDFGIAKLVGDDPRWTHPATTDTGTVMGTVGYMSPEQVRGEHADHRSDIFSFGVILYEMLSGVRAFDRPTGAETGNAILHDDPPKLPEALPEQLRRAVERCLEKDPAERFQSARDLAFLLEGITGTSGAKPVQISPRRRWLRPALAGALLTVLGLLVGRQIGAPRAPAPVRFRSLSQGHQFVVSARFAPDGSTVVYSSAPVTDRGVGHFATWVERIDRPRPQLLLDKSVVRSVSPAGELLVLLNPVGTSSGMRGTLARLPLAGGTPRELVPDVEDADWLPDGAGWAQTRSVQGKRTLEFPQGHVVFETPGTIGRLRVSPDGKNVAFFDQPMAYDDRGYVAVADRAGNVRRLAGEFSTMNGLAWRGDEILFSASPDASDAAVYAVTLSGALRQLQAAPGRLVIEDLRAGTSALLHFTVDRSGTTLHMPDGSTREIDSSDNISPCDVGNDGTVLLGDYTDIEGPTYGAWVQRAADAAPARLGNGIPVALSPAQDRVLILEYGQHQQMDLVPLGAGEPRPVALAEGLIYQWGWFFPDGKRLLLVAGRAGESLKYGWQALDGREFHPLVDARVGLIANAAISPDGQTIATSGFEGELRLTPVDGGPSRTLPAPFDDRKGAPIRWSKDGKTIYVARGSDVGRTAEVRAVDVETGKSETWLKIETPPGYLDTGQLRLSPDARAWAFDRGTGMSRLVLAENLP